MFKWKLSAESKAKATSKNVWAIWTDVSSWPKWDHELEWSVLEGPFKVGTKGKLKPKGWFASTFEIISVEKDKSHSDKTVMPLTEVIFSHEVTSCDQSHVKIEHTVVVKGLLAPLLWLTMRNKLKSGLPSAVNRLALLAEEHANL